MQQFDPNREFLKTCPFQTNLGPNCILLNKDDLFRFLHWGGLQPGPKSKKNYNKNAIGNQNTKSRGDFWRSGPGNHGEIVNSILLPSKWFKKWWYARVRLEKSSGTQDTGSKKIMVRTMLLYFSRAEIVRTAICSSRNRPYQRLFTRKIMVRTIWATFCRPSFWSPPSSSKYIRKATKLLENKWFWDHCFSWFFAFLKFDFWTTCIFEPRGRLNRN